MAESKATSAEDKIIVKQFKIKSNDWWVGNLHYTLLNGELICAAGGIETEESRDKITKYLRIKRLL